ncbi:hypothetical protein, partial [Vibrio sp. UCD-FRSSP16_30]|uniref:hypothetical protein n=2 Tax=unclassified Vibrio TaxID=2614977 RepID=UPI0018D3072B
WQVNNETFTSEHNYKLLKGFLARVLPEHPIKLAVTHGDERLDHEDLCSHIHCFIDGKNSITQTFDLRHTEERAIDRYVTNTLSMEEQNIWTECKAKKNYQYSKLRGEYWQAMFLLYANYFLENENIPLKAVRLEKTQERIEKNKQMRVEAKLPKHQRSHNFHTRALEEEKMILERIAQAERLEATRIREYEKEQETRDAERQSARAKSIKQEEEIQANEKHLQLIKNRNDTVTKGLEKKIQIQAQLNYDNERLAIDKADNIARLKELADQVDANDIVKILLKIFASIDRYISSKKSDSHYQTFYRQVIEAFKDLNDWAIETLVMKYLKVGEHEIKDYLLTKELEGLQTPRRENTANHNLNELMK